MAKVARVDELGRRCRRPGPLVSFIRHAAIPIRLRTESGKFRQLQGFGAARFGRIDRSHLGLTKLLRCRRTEARKTDRS